MPLVYGVYAPNAPTLIAPEVFGGVTHDVAEKLRALDVVGRHRPDAIVVATPHWVARSSFQVQESERPRQLFDFSGFPPELSSVRYEPPGDPDLARAFVAFGRGRRVPAEGTRVWGLDHGAWAPLLHLAPGGRVPVVPLSISQRSPGDHMAWGRAVGEAIRASPKRVVVVGTGSITHSFARMNPNSGATWGDGERIEREIVDLILRRRYDDVAGFDRAKWRTIEPEGDLGPAFILFGALGSSFAPRLVSTGQVWGAFGTTILDFVPD
jgi:4,5-DOPA dioxygenase extradiol